MDDAGMSERKICIAREITKLHEEFIRGTVAECIELLENHNKLKGEFVIVVDAKKN